MFYDCEKKRPKKRSTTSVKMSSNGSGGGDQPSEGCGDTLVLGEMPGDVPAGSSFTGTSKNKWNGLELARAAEADER